jgi:hypothetical protein
MVNATAFVRATAGSGRVAGAAWACPACAGGAPATGTPTASPTRLATQPSTMRRDGCRP